MIQEMMEAVIVMVEAVDMEETMVEITTTIMEIPRALTGGRKIKQARNKMHTKNPSSDKMIENRV